MKKKSKQTLQQIQEKRTGGAIAIRGFNFQFIYSAYQILLELSKDNNNSIGLEGIEDIDIPHKNEFIQVKSSINSIDSNIFWKMGVLKNYLEVYQSDFNINFKLVHNTTISNGHLKSFEKGKFNKKSLDYWTDKIQTLNSGKDINIEKFLKKIKFEKTSKDELIAKSKKLLLEKFDLNNGTEEQFLIALLYQITQWSEERKTVQYQDLLQVIQFVTDNFSKTPTNLAIKENWITKVNYDDKNLSTDMGYFDGKSAKPIHIALGLPVKRTFWIDKIEKEVKEFDITVIKSSSGQGKSTLAWQVAQDFKEFGYTIYQLNYCHDDTKVEDLFDFIETRIKIGEIPLIIIDGLDQRVKEWTSLAERLFSFPIKIVVTTREEDWYRYGIDISKVQLKIIDIKLLENEAKDIFIEFQKRDKIHKSIQNWQSVWEQVASKKLLIEYVYLLTHGQMIKNRLKEQIEKIEQEDNDKVKFEILSIIALADICNIQIKTKKLTKYIEENIDSKLYIGKLYKMLNNEYYLQFDKKYIEGLHPVRSQHLIDILHEFVSIEESLISLLKIIDDESVYDYFIKVLFLVDEEEREEFLEESAEIIANREFAEMVQAIDGLMHFTVYSYWLENRKVYDNVHNVTGAVDAFVLSTIPFLETETLATMVNIFKTDTSSYLLKEEKKLSEYSFENTLITYFCKKISKLLDKKSLKDYKTYKDLDYLIKWLNKTNTIAYNFLQFNKNFLLKEMESKEVNLVTPLYNYCFIVYPDEYLTFIEKYKMTLFSILKKKTNSLILEEKKNELNIKYLHSMESNKKPNDTSIDRIEVFKTIFPQYTQFNADILYLPFPNEDIYKYVSMEAHKTIPSENLFDEFDIHINVVWRKTLMKQYTYQSVYEWQEHHYLIRLKFLEFIKASNRLIEYLLEGKKGTNIYPLYQEVTTLLRERKEFPSKTIKYNEDEKLKDEIQNISTFQVSFRQFINRLANLLDKTDTHLSFINLKEAFFKLYEMQQAFKTIQKNTYSYYDTTDLEKEESIWLKRLLNTVTFLIESPQQRMTVAKDNILEWHENRRVNEMKNIHNILKKLEENLLYKIYYPHKVIYNKHKEVVIGIEKYDNDDIEDIILTLVDFYKLDIDFINIVHVSNKKAYYGFRVSKSFFERVNHELEGGEFQESEFGNPRDIFVTKEELETLNEKIELEIPSENTTQSKFIKVMYDIWKLIEYRIYLDKNSDIEREWLEENERKIIIGIQENIDTLNDDEKDFIFDIIDEKMDISKEEIVIYMNEKIAIKSEET